MPITHRRSRTTLLLATAFVRILHAQPLRYNVTSRSFTLVDSGGDRSGILNVFKSIQKMYSNIKLISVDTLRGARRHSERHQGHVAPAWGCSDLFRELDREYPVHDSNRLRSLILLPAGWLGEPEESRLVDAAVHAATTASAAVVRSAAPGAYGRRGSAVRDSRPGKPIGLQRCQPACILADGSPKPPELGPGGTTCPGPRATGVGRRDPNRDD